MKRAREKSPMLGGNPSKEDIMVNVSKADLDSHLLDMPSSL